MRPTTKPPAKPSCEGWEPELFDQTAYNKTALGLSVCSTCPVRAWCLDHMDPANNDYDGIVGGYVWKHGLVLNGDTTDRTLTDYLDGHADRNPPNKVDELAVELFLAGQLEWTKLNSADRVAAAIHLYTTTNLSRHQIMEKCHLSGATFQIKVAPSNPTRSQAERRPPQPVDPGKIQGYLDGRLTVDDVNIMERVRIATHYLTATTRTQDSVLKELRLSWSQYRAGVTRSGD